MERTAWPARASTILENRGKPISAREQFDRFKAWAAEQPTLNQLGDRVLYGERLFAEHGTRYDQLPDYFIAYDLWDRDFRSAQEVRDTCDAPGIICNPSLEFGRGGEDLLALARERSLFGTGPREGIYCRIEEDGRCVGRAKLVRPGYRPRTDEEWKRGMVRNARRKK